MLKSILAMTAFLFLSLAGCAPAEIAEVPDAPAVALPTAPRAPSAPDATPTLAPTVGPTSTPTITPTPTRTPTPTITPTPLPVISIGHCAPIWQPGYYKITANIKTPELDCFQVQGHNIIIDCQGFTVEGRNFQGYAFFVRQFFRPFLETPTNVEIKNCKATRHRAGIFVSGGNNIYLHDNDLSGNRDDVNADRFGIFLGLTEGGGIRLDNVRGGIVENNVTSKQAIGIDVRDSDRVIIRNNTASKNSAWGINLINTSNSEIYNNTTQDNIRYCAWGNGTVGRGCDAGGIVLQDGSSNNIVRDNLISGENGNGIFIKAHALRCGNNNLLQNNKILNAVYNAIELSFCKDNQIIGNELVGSYDAIFFGYTTGTIVRGNKIAEMQNHGIISINSRGSIIEGNQITNAREGIYLYYTTWDPKEFFFLTPTPDQYAVRDHSILNNKVSDNAVAGIRLANVLFSRVEGNTFANNARNLWIEGKTDGTVISENGQ